MSVKEFLAEYPLDAERDFESATKRCERGLGGISANERFVLRDAGEEERRSLKRAAAAISSFKRIAR